MPRLQSDIEGDISSDPRELILRLLDRYEKPVLGQKIRSILTSPDLVTISSRPGKISAHSLLAQSKNRFQSASAAGARTIGMSDLIDILESLSPTEQLLCFHFCSESQRLIGTCYTNITARQLLGCTWVEKRVNPPGLDPRLIPEPL